MEPEPCSNDARFDFGAGIESANRQHMSGWPNRRCMCAAVLFTLLLHGYALSILPSLLELEPWDDVVEVALINDDISIDPDVITSYNVDRSEDVSVPPPPGFGGHQPQAGQPSEPLPELIPPPAEFRGDVGMGGGTGDQQ